MRDLPRSTSSSPAVAALRWRRCSGRNASPPAAFTVRLRPERDVIYVKPVGELDLATTPRLRAELDELVAAGFTHIVIDLRALLFIDCAGIRLLTELEADARRRRWRLSLTQGRACVQRVFELTATVDLLPFTAPLATRGPRPRPATNPPARRDRLPRMVTTAAPLP